MKRTLNTTINRSKSEKNNEHYTQLADIENEVGHYRDQFRGKECWRGGPTLLGKKSTSFVPQIQQ